MKIESKKLQEYAKDMFCKAGTTEEEAAIVAEELVTSNLMGLDSHGVLRIPQYLDQIKEGLIIANCKRDIYYSHCGWQSRIRTDGRT